jgi:hypothetical protein
MLFPIFQFDATLFMLSFLATQFTTWRFPKLRLFILNGTKRIKIHHAYIGALIAFFAGLAGQVALVNIGLGTMSNDIFCHLRKLLRIKIR